jgi:hypothetical protein
MLFYVASICIHILELPFLITLQEQIDTVTIEGVEDVGEEDCIKNETEEDYIQLMDRVKCEQEVSVLSFVFCGGDLFTGARACVCVCCDVHCV